MNIQNKWNLFLKNKNFNVFKLQFARVFFKYFVNILFYLFISENHYDDRVSSYSEVDEELLKKFGYQKDIISSPVSINYLSTNLF